MTARRLCLLAAAGSAVLLAVAWGFQWAGYAPCQMCLWQRWPHWIALALAPALLVLPALAVAPVGLAATLATAGISAFHTGVERGWWAGPASCAGGTDLGSLSGADLLSTAIPETVVMCDEVAWSMAGLSMASWNMLASLALAALWGAALLHAARAGRITAR